MFLHNKSLDSNKKIVTRLLSTWDISKAEMQRRNVQAWYWNNFNFLYT